MYKYYLKLNLNKDKTASSKAKLDIEDFVSEAGYRPVNFDKQLKFKFFKTVLGFMINTFSQGSILLVQYPFVSRKKMEFIKKIFGDKLRLVAVVHDLNSVRFPEEIPFEKEKENMAIYEYLIVHNKKMKELLNSRKLNVKMYELEMFDYKCDDIEKGSLQRENSICFAGNLDEAKSGFIYNFTDGLFSTIKVNLYGVNYSNNVKMNNIDYKGSFPSEELPKILNEKFGLIWDGNAIDECSGDIGRYLKYINPHKASLYIVSSLPIICWQESAIAEYVNEKKIGLSINSLTELEEKICSLTADEYNQILNNIEVEKKKLTNGYYIKNVLKKIENENI